MLTKAAFIWLQVQTVILWNIISISNKFVLFEYILKCNSPPPIFSIITPVFSVLKKHLLLLIIIYYD